ncbi:MAG: hypothetical protein JWQ79_3964 [Mucilaginibacter sp.]|jgi:protein CpxP|nr:hypothetical protein [Mucilaginibacter sp.]
MKKLLLVCAFVIGVSAVSFAQGRGPQTPAQQIDRLKTQITGLSDDQVAKLTVIYTAQGKTMDSLRTAANGDFAAMRPAFTKMNDATTVKIKAILTPDQATEYQKVLDARAERMKQQQSGN